MYSYQDPTFNINRYMNNDSDSDSGIDVESDISSVISNFSIGETVSEITNFSIDDSSVISEDVDPTEFTIEKYFESKVPKKILMWNGEVVDIDANQLKFYKHVLTKRKWLSPEEMIPLGQEEIIHYNISELSEIIHESIYNNIVDNMKIRDSYKRTKLNMDELFKKIQSNDVSPAEIEVDEIEYIKNWTDYLKVYNEKIEYIMHLMNYRPEPKLIKYFAGDTALIDCKLDFAKKLEQHCNDSEFLEQLGRYEQNTRNIDKTKQNSADDKEQKIGNILLWTGELIDVDEKDFFTIKYLIKKRGPGNSPKTMTGYSLNKRIYNNNWAKEKFRGDADFRDRIATRRLVNDRKYRGCYKVLKEMYKNKAIRVNKEYMTRIRKILDV